jgi:hypothetical protein
VESTSTVSSLVDVPARLSPAQKRDLVGQAVAAVITTALIAAPLINPPSSGADVSSETALPAQSFVGAVTAVAVKDAATPIATARRPRAITRGRLRTDGRLIASAVPPMMMQPNVIAMTQLRTVGTSGYVPGVDAAPERSGSRKPLSRKVTGWLTGDGSHTVRPFPTFAVAARH